MTLGQNGLFTRAREGRAAYEESEVRDDLSMLITQYTWDKASEKTDKSLGEYLKDNGAISVKENLDGNTLEVWYKDYVFTVDIESGNIIYETDRKPKVGDIVMYTPNMPDIGYNLSTDKSGYSDIQTIDSAYDPTTWKIMEVDENGNITKLFGVPSSSQKYFNFSGSTGYNNGVYVLNDICKSRYGNEKLGATARNLNIEDIEAKMNETGIIARNAYTAGTVRYGTTRKYVDYTKYPVIYSQEKYSGVNVSDVVDGTQVITGNINATEQTKMNLNGKIDSDNIYTILPNVVETTGSSVSNLTCTQTFYYLSSVTSSYFNDKNFYNMIFETGTNFWLASRCVSCNSNISFAYFGLRYVYNSNLSGTRLFYSDDTKYDSHSRIAPVVSLGSGIQVKSGSGTTSDPYVIGK